MPNNLAVERSQLCIQGLAMLFHAGNRAARAELHVGIGGGQVHAGTRKTGLNDDRPLLRRGQRRERSADVEIAAAVVDPVHLSRVRENTFLAVRNKCIFLNAIPQFAGNFEKLLRPQIANVVIHHDLEAVIRSLVLVSRRDGIPRDPSARHVVERIEKRAM